MDADCFRRMAICLVVPMTCCKSRDYREIFEHLQVKKGELLVKGCGPKRLVEAWDLDDGIIARVV